MAPGKWQREARRTLSPASSAVPNGPGAATSARPSFPATSVPTISVPGGELPPATAVSLHADAPPQHLRGRPGVLWPLSQTKVSSELQVSDSGGAECIAALPGCPGPWRARGQKGWVPKPEWLQTLDASAPRTVTGDVSTCRGSWV